MNGLEMMGIWFGIILALGVAMGIVWIIGSVWRNNRDINELLVRLRYIENALLTSNQPKTKRK